MNISDLELFLVELPAADGPARSLVIRLATESGLEGWGETRNRWRAGELPARRDQLLSVLAGRDVFDLQSILELDVLADAAVAAGVEMALWDLIALGARQPLCNLLGGEYRRRIPLAVALPAGSGEVANWARAFSNQGIQSQVIPSTGSVDDDLRQLAAVREACGGRALPRLDARSLYEISTAVQLCHALDPATVQIVLDPLAGGDPEQLSVLRRKIPTEITLGVRAGVRSPRDVIELARSDAAAAVVIDPIVVGGLTRARCCAEVAAAAGLTASLGLRGTSGLAVSAVAHLAASTPSCTGVFECAYPKLRDDILCEALVCADGMLAVPSAAGLGVEVDREKLEAFQVLG